MRIKMNLIGNASFYLSANEIVPDGNYTIVGTSVILEDDEQLAQINKYVNCFKLTKGSKYITFSITKETADVSSFTLSYYLKGTRDNMVKVTVTYLDSESNTIATEIIVDMVERFWKRFNHLLSTTVICDSLTIKMETLDEVIYLAMPQVEEGSTLTDFAEDFEEIIT